MLKSTIGAETLMMGTIGFPEYHSVVIAQYPAFFEALPRIESTLNGLTGEAHESISAEQHLILNLGILGGVSMMEIVLLAANGFGPGAQKSLRSLLEAAITAEYIRLHPAAYEDFWEFYKVERHKQLKYLRDYLPSAFAQLDEQEVRQIETDFEGVRQRFGNRLQWSKHNLAEQAALTGYTDSYRLTQPVGSGFVHVTPLGMHRRFDDEDPFRIDVPPSLNWVEQSLVSGHLLSLGMIRTLVRCFHPEQETSIYPQLEDAFQVVWPRKSD